MQQCQQLPLSSLSYNSLYIPALSLSSSLFWTCVYVFILATPDLTCGVWTLRCGTWDLIPRPRPNPGPPQWKCWASGTGLPGRSPLFLFFATCSSLLTSSVFPLSSSSLGGKETPHGTLCCLCVTDPQWPITNRLWKKRCDLSPIMTHIRYLCCDMWTEEQWNLYLLKYSCCPLAADIWTLFLEDLFS